MLGDRLENPAEAIGGYFGLDLPDFGEPYPQAIRYQSARAAIRAVLECNGIRRAWIPAYVCDSVLCAAQQAGVEVCSYMLDDALYPHQLPATLADDEVVLYVNYFGLCQSAVIRLQTQFPAERLIIDNSHAMFAPHSGVLATVYSPRKFAGLPDGGLLLHSPTLRIIAPVTEDTGSFERMKFLLLRAACSAREGYAAFNEARNSLNGLPPLAMSRLTQRLMRSIDWQQAKVRRHDNFAIMTHMLGDLNRLHWAPTDDDVPLCYPLALQGVDVAAIKASLAAQDIFTATYWPDAMSRIRPGSIEATLVHDTLFLPVDQRLDVAQAEMAARRVLELLHHGSRKKD